MKGSNDFSWASIWFQNCILRWFQSTVFNHISSSSNIAGKTFHVGDKHSTWAALIAGLHMMRASVRRTVTYCSVLKHIFEVSFRCIPRVDLVRLGFISLCCGCLLMSCMLHKVLALPTVHCIQIWAIHQYWSFPCSEGIAFLTDLFVLKFANYIAFLAIHTAFFLFCCFGFCW